MNLLRMNESLVMVELWNTSSLLTFFLCPTTIKWAAPASCFLTIMSCLSWGQKQWTQTTINWNVYKCGLKLIFFTLNCLHQVFSHSTDRGNFKQYILWIHLLPLYYICVRAVSLLGEASLPTTFCFKTSATTYAGKPAALSGNCGSDKLLFSK